MREYARAKKNACARKKHRWLLHYPQPAKRLQNARIRIYLPFLPPVRQYAYAHSSRTARR